MGRHMALLISKHEWLGQETSRRGYNYDLAVIARELEKRQKTILEMQLQDWNYIVSERNWSYKTQRRKISSLRALLKLRGITRHFILDIEWPSGARKDPRRLKPAQRDVCLAATYKQREILGIRNRAIIWTFWDLGIRKFELCGALLVDLDLNPEDPTLQLLTKAASGRNGKYKPRAYETKMYVNDDAVAAMDAWLDVRDRIADPRSKTIFVSQNGGRALSPEGVSDVFKALSKVAGFPVSAHDFRRGAGTDAVERGVPDRLIMKQLGIRTHKVFQGYTARASLRAYRKLMRGNS